MMLQCSLLGAWIQHELCKCFVHVEVSCSWFIITVWLDATDSATKSPTVLDMLSCHVLTGCFMILLSGILTCTIKRSQCKQVVQPSTDSFTFVLLTLAGVQLDTAV